MSASLADLDPDQLACPVCGGPVAWDSACPGYHGHWNGRPTIMVCDGCGNADEWTCRTIACGWWYREPNIRSDAKLMGVRPPWLPPTQEGA